MDHNPVEEPSDSTFDALSTAFLNAFKSQPGASLHPSLEIDDLRFRNAGRGIVAIEDIPAGTDLFVIPRDHVISVETSALSQKLPRLFDGSDPDDAEIVEDAEDALVELPKPWLNLILVLLYEYFHRETSRWREYWDVLPETFDTLMFWSQAELAELQASASRSKIGREDADAMFRKKILPAVVEFEDVFYPDGAQSLDEESLLDLAHRMGSLIMAYAFDLQNEAEPDEEGGDGDDGWMEDREGTTAMGMVVMADMLNADAEFNAHLEHGETELTMRSLREIKKGEEVLNYYGPLPNSDLLRRYGYTSQKHARYDVVEISWKLVCDGVKAVFGETPQAIITEDEDLEESFVLERDGGDPDETGVNTTKAKFTTFPEELVEQTTTLTSAALGIVGQPNEEQKRKLKQSFLQVMAKVLPARLAEYSTSVVQDEQLLQRGSASGRLKMAIDVRLGEKYLLREAENLVVELLQKYSDQASNNGTASERPSKKQRTKK